MSIFWQWIKDSTNKVWQWKHRDLKWLDLRIVSLLKSTFLAVSYFKMIMFWVVIWKILGGLSQRVKSIYGLDRSNTLLKLKNCPLLSCVPHKQHSSHCFDGVFDSVMLKETLYGLSSSNNSTRIEIHRGSLTPSIMVIQTSFSNKLISTFFVFTVRLT